MNKTVPTTDSGSTRIVKNSFLRGLLWTVGSICLVLGVLGIFLPVLPTTPFLLLTAACYLRSSEKFYNWLVSHPKLSRYILAYLDGRGLPRRAKYYTLSVLWLTISFSVYIVPLLAVKVMLVLIAGSVSVYIWRLPDLEFDDSPAISQVGKVDCS